MIHNIKNHARKSVQCKKSPNIVVKEGLSYTPAQMQALASKGIPISSQSVSDSFNDGDFSSSMSIDPCRCRGFDIIDAWNLEKDSKQKLINAHITDSNYFE